MGTFNKICVKNTLEYREFGKTINEIGTETKDPSMFMDYCNRWERASIVLCKC
jgi:hypothetical protein